MEIGIIIVSSGDPTFECAWKECQKDSEVVVTIDRDCDESHEIYVCKECYEDVKLELKKAADNGDLDSDKHSCVPREEGKAFKHFRNLGDTRRNYENN
jgi:hypothetical protein